MHHHSIARDRYGDPFCFMQLNFAAVRVNSCVTKQTKERNTNMSEPLANELELDKYVGTLVDGYIDEMRDGASEDDILDRIIADSDWSEHVIYYYKAKALVDIEWRYNSQFLDEAEEEVGFELTDIFTRLAGIILRKRLEERFQNRLIDEKVSK